MRDDLRRSICIIDDDPDIREALRLVLEMEGYRVTEGAGGSEGLAFLKEHPSECFLILLDLMMPNMSGWEFRQRQLEEPHLASIPVVILSGTRGVAEHARDLGVAGYMVKPVDRTELLETVKRFIGEEHRTNRETTSR